MRDQLNAGATSETTRTLKTIHIIHAHIYSNKADMKDDYDGQMMFGDLVGLKLPDICLTDEEKPWKNLTQETSGPIKLGFSMFFAEFLNIHTNC